MGRRDSSGTRYGKSGNSGPVDTLREALEPIGSLGIVRCNRIAKQ